MYENNFKGKSGFCFLGLSDLGQSTFSNEVVRGFRQFPVRTLKSRPQSLVTFSNLLYTARYIGQFHEFAVSLDSPRSNQHTKFNENSFSRS
jgi:hypothetical protein